jgi:hypothetical protein
MIEIRYRIVHDDKYIELTKLELEKLKIEINNLLMSKMDTTDTAFPTYPTFPLDRVWIDTPVINPLNPEW